MEDRSLVVEPLLSTIRVLSSTISVSGAQPLIAMLMLLASESTFETRPTVRFRLAELPVELRSIEPRELEVPMSLAVLPEPLEPVPLWPYVEPLPVLEPVPLWPEVEPLVPVPRGPAAGPVAALPAGAEAG